MRKSQTPTSPFPSEEIFAQAFFQEVCRHLSDAYVLHTHQRYAAAITSSMKAAELSVKSVLILDGALRHWDRLLKTHSPVSDLQTNRFFSQLHRSLDAHRAGLVDEVKEMESLEPTHFETLSGRSQANPVVNDANTEYPFLILSTPVAQSHNRTELRRPENHFGAIDSERYFGISREVIVALISVYRAAQRWNLTVAPTI